MKAASLATLVLRFTAIYIAFVPLWILLQFFWRLIASLFMGDLAPAFGSFMVTSIIMLILAILLYYWSRVLGRIIAYGLD